MRLINSRWILGAAITVLSGLAIADARADEHLIRWDIIRVVTFDPVNGNTIDAGGTATASAADNSMITVTGSGTFNLAEDDEVTGGGTWQTIAPPPATTASGTYRVTELIRFDVAPGAQASNTKDLIGNGTLADNRAGLAFLRIAYSDGSKGVLVVSCKIPGNPPPGPAGAPASLFEGITASKGFVDYWNHADPVSGVNGNRTLFHVTTEKE